MPYVTSSLVEAVNTCPKWGIIHSVQHKRFVTGFRQMALEAGSLMHEVFSALNLWHIAANQHLPYHADYHGRQLFGTDRWNALSFTKLVTASETNPEAALDSLAYAVIATSDFYDDPNDKNRTIANLNHAASELVYYFLKNHVRFNIYVADKDDPRKPIGIEQSLDVVFDCWTEVTANGSSVLIIPLRFIGLIDTVYQNPITNLVTLGEYKTTSSMSDGWREAFKTRHQISAYQGALGAYFDNVSWDTILTGSNIPVRKTTPPLDHFIVNRDPQFVISFLQTALHSMQIINTYRDSDAIYAPMFTHSCNRYFRPCSLIDLCSSEITDQQIMHEQMVITEELSPSEMKAFLRQEN